MVLSRFDFYLLGIAGALFLILLRQWIIDSRNKATAILNKGEKLRSVFFEDLLTLKEGMNSSFAINPVDYLEDRFPIHEVAVIDFANNIGWFKRKRFMDAWNSYCGKENEVDEHDFYQYSSSGHDSKEVIRRKKLAIQRIEHLLSFTKT